MQRTRRQFIRDGVSAFTIGLAAPAFLLAARTDLMVRAALLIPASQRWYGVQREGVQASISLVYDIR